LTRRAVGLPSARRVKRGNPRASIARAIYAPVEAHQIVELQTPLACTIIDTEKLAFCGKPASVAFAWLVEDEIEGALWRLRPVCRGCVALGNQ